MSLILPPSNSPIRELFSMSDLAELPAAVKDGRVRRLWKVVSECHCRVVADAFVVSANYIAIFENSIVLAKVSSESVEVIWNFGSVDQFL